MSTKPEYRQVLVRPEPQDAVQKAIEAGIDISMLRDNLARTPAERLRRHDIAL